MKSSDQIKQILALYGVEVDLIERTYHTWDRHVMGEETWAWYYQPKGKIYCIGSFRSMREFIKDWKESQTLYLIDDNFGDEPFIQAEINERFARFELQRL
jgi:hypothetical protein